MCYSPEVSLGTFLFVGAICIYIWKRNHPIDKSIAIILGSIVLMQLIEFFIWINPSCGPINRFFTALIPILLVLQPILMLWAVGHYKAGWAIGYKELAVFYSVTGFAALSQAFSEPLKYTGIKNGHLEWPLKSYFVDNNIYTRLYNYGTSYAIATLNNIPLSALFITATVSSHYYYKIFADRAWPSLWCHFCNLLAVAAVALN